MASEVKEEQNSKQDVSEGENAADESPQECDSSTKVAKNESKKDVKVESEEEDEEVGLLDRPVEVTGCRARKKVERLEMSFSVPKEKQEYVEGKGVKLGECPRIEVQIQKIQVHDLKPLHRLLFNRTGSANEIKKNIRKFSGFSFEQNSPGYVRKKGILEKMTIAGLKQACLILDLERGGTKQDLSDRIMSFLLMPEDSGKQVPVKSKTAKEKKKKSTGAKTEKKTKSGKKGKTVKAVKEESKNEAMYDDDSSGGDASMGGTDEENEADSDEPKIKSKEKKKAKPKLEKEKKDEKPKAIKRKIEDSSDDSGDEEPEAKKANQMPSDEEISKLIKQILEAADLQEITMKKVIKQVSDTYPDFDLTHKKPFIKTTIKSVIS